MLKLDVSSLWRAPHCMGMCRAKFATLSNISARYPSRDEQRTASPTEIRRKIFLFPGSECLDEPTLRNKISQGSYTGLSGNYFSVAWHSTRVDSAKLACCTHSSDRSRAVRHSPIDTDLRPIRADLAPGIWSDILDKVVARLGGRLNARILRRQSPYPDCLAAEGCQKMQMIRQ